MKKSTSLFQKHCEKAIEKLSDKSIEDFKLLKDEESRIKHVYDTARNIPVELKDGGKNFLLALEEKNKGNQFFSKKDYKNALKSYNNGIIACPQDADASRELLTILISNRSATYFELKEFKRVFNDIDYLLEIGNYPTHLQYKIWLRKAKCYSALQNERSSEESYNEALECLKHSNLEEKDLSNKINEIEAARKNKTTTFVAHNEVVPFLNSDLFMGGNQYISAHPKISFEQDTVQGRYATALEDIEAGTIIVEENPHCLVITSGHTISNCQSCAVATDQPIACPTCAHVVFCSSNCERQCNRSFHKIECTIQQSLFESGASVNCSMALRIVSQKALTLFREKRKQLKDFLKDSCKRNVIKKKTYRPDDYDNVFFLCRNENERKKGELMHYSIMAVYLLRLLKVGGYFPNETKDDLLTEEELFIGGLILRHLQILEFNAHEVSELQNVKNPTGVEGLKTFYENTTIGAALYPTLALFNHSCDPSIVRYNIKNKIVVRTIKPIKAGETIYENYGPLYMNMPVEERQEFLKTKYRFECLCSPCVELWPTFNELDDKELRIPCKTSRCPYIFVVRDNDDPFLTCDYCNNITSIIPHLKGLMALREILPEAEELYNLKQLDSAMKVFLRALTILFKYSKPPHPDIIKIQQRIRVCMVHNGNKACDYKIIL